MRVLLLRSGVIVKSVIIVVKGHCESVVVTVRGHCKSVVVAAMWSISCHYGQEFL